MLDETRKALYLNQIALYGRVVLSRENGAWFLQQMAGSVKTSPIAILPEAAAPKVRQTRKATAA